MVKCMRKRRNKNQIRIVVWLIVCLLLIMTAGYAAFSTNLSLNAKGSIIGTFTFRNLIDKEVTTGDGLYMDPVESGRYVYRGEAPENYIEFNGEMWRILAIEADGTAKVIRQGSIGLIPFDEPYVRSDSTYCPISSSGSYGQNIDFRYGCNAWVSENGSFVNGSISGTLTKDASLNTYLNNDYYNSLDFKVQRSIQKHNFYYGGGNIYIQPGLSTQEKSKIWNGNVGLINLSDYQKASLSSNYCNLETDCLNNNYIFSDVLNGENTCWTLNILLNNSLIIRDLYRGKINTSFPRNNYAVYPVLFLRSDLLVYGKGTKAEPYRIKTPN